MIALLQLIAQNALWLYILGAAALLYYLRELIGARQTARQSLFGLEREGAQQRQARAGLMLALTAGSLGVVALLSGVVAPRLGAEAPLVVLNATPDAPFLATPPTDTPTTRPTASLTPTRGTPAPTNSPETTPLPSDTPAAETPAAETPEPLPSVPALAGCGDPNQYLSAPASGSVVGGVVAIFGTADISGFEYYKFEVRGASTNGDWATVAVFRQAVRDGQLGTWDATAWQPGPYELRLVVVDNTGNFPTPCVINLAVQGNGP